MLTRYRGGIVPPLSDNLASEATTTRNELIQLFKENELQAGLMIIWKFISRMNQYVDETAPFKLAKDETQSARLGQVLYNLTEGCRHLAIWLQPYLPTTSHRILEQLNLPIDVQNIADSRWGELTEGHKINAPKALFPRRDI